MRLQRLAFRRSNRPGVTVVETALVLPLFLLMVCGLIEVGWVMYVWQSMNFASREAVRTMSVRGYTADEAQSHAADYLKTCANYDFAYFPDAGPNKVSLEIRLPVHEATLFAGKFFSENTMLVSRAELYRETAY